MIGALVVLCLAADPPAAKEEPPPRFADEILVTAERGPETRAETPAAVSVLTRGEVAALPAENLAEVLDALPGFQVLFADGFGAPPIVSARGFFGGGEADYVQLRVDGVPVGDVESGLGDWRRFRAAEIERVEAARGPGSAAYGDTALGGVVQVFRRVSAGPRVRELAASGGSFGSWSGDALFRGGQDVRFALSGTAGRTRGFRAHGAAEEAAADLWLGANRGPGLWSLTVAGSARDRDEAGPLAAEALARDRFSSDPLFRFDRDDTRRGRIALSLRRGGTLPFLAVVHGARRRTEAVRTLLLAAGLGDRALRDLSTDSVGASWEGEKAFGAGRAYGLRAGVDVARDWLDTSYAPVDEEGGTGARIAAVSGRRDRLGAFASADWRAARRLRLATGLRWDGITDEAGGVVQPTRSRAWSPRAGATLQVGALGGAPVSLFAQAARAFKAATLDQRLDPRPFPDFAGGSFRISNPDLTPQRAATLEAGASQGVAGGRWEIAAYRTSVDDEIDFDPATFRYRNIGRSLHYGVEASARAFEGSPVTPFASYAWTRVEARAEGRRGLQLRNIPAHLLRAGVALRLPRGVRADLRFTWSGGRWLDDENQVAAADARVLDLRVQKVLGPVRVRLDGLNLTGHRWEPLAYTLPDFTGGVVPYYVPATPRAVRLGVEWTF